MAAHIGNSTCSNPHVRWRGQCAPNIPQRLWGVKKFSGTHTPLCWSTDDRALQLFTKVGLMCLNVLCCRPSFVWALGYQKSFYTPKPQRNMWSALPSSTHVCRWAAAVASVAATCKFFLFYKSELYNLPNLHVAAHTANSSCSTPHGCWRGQCAPHIPQRFWGVKKFSGTHTPLCWSTANRALQQSTKVRLMCIKVVVLCRWLTNIRVKCAKNFFPHKNRWEIYCAHIGLYFLRGA